MRQLVYRKRLAYACGQLWGPRMWKMRLEALLHVGWELGLETIIEETNAAVIMMAFLLRRVHVVLEAEAHGIVLLLSRSSSMD